MNNFENLSALLKIEIRFFINSIFQTNFTCLLIYRAMENHPEFLLDHFIRIFVTHHLLKEFDDVSLF